MLSSTHRRLLSSAEKLRTEQVKPRPASRGEEEQQRAASTERGDRTEATQRGLHRSHRPIETNRHLGSRKHPQSVVPPPPRTGAEHTSDGAAPAVRALPAPAEPSPGRRRSPAAPCRARALREARRVGQAVLWECRKPAQIYRGAAFVCFCPAGAAPDNRVLRAAGRCPQ